MATHPITDLLAELEILAFQALDFGAQLHYFPARVLDWVNQLRGGVARTTDLYQLVDHDHLGLPRRPRFGKRRVPFYPLQTDLYGRDWRSFTFVTHCVANCPGPIIGFCSASMIRPPGRSTRPRRSTPCGPCAGVG